MLSREEKEILRDYLERHVRSEDDKILEFIELLRALHKGNEWWVDSDYLEKVTKLFARLVEKNIELQKALIDLDAMVERHHIAKSGSVKIRHQHVERMIDKVIDIYRLVESLISI